MAALCMAALTASCGSRPPAGLPGAVSATGNCASVGASGQRTCTPDIGSKPVDCQAEEAGIELVKIGDFGPADKASYFYAYTDRSGLGSITSFSDGWQANTESDPFPRCHDGSTPRAVHLQGGPFLGWGGGFGSSAKDWLPNANELDPALDCFANPTSPLCASSDLPVYLEGKTINVSSYEGVAFWARRGPDSQGGIRINVGDINTDDDISYLTYQHDPSAARRCERVRECGCINHKACQQWNESPFTVFNMTSTTTSSESWSCTSAGEYCGDPNAGIVPGYYVTSGPTVRCNGCGRRRCDEPYEAYPDGVVSSDRDTQFNGKPCTDYTFRSGVRSAFCFDPATDPPPADTDQQCGDHWQKSIQLTNQWKLYLVPFNQMLQQGFGKRADKMDLEHVTMIRLTWEGGWIDYWVGRIGFYRRKSAT